MATVKGLLFDIGEVVTREQWDLLDEVERLTGRTLTGRGPLDPAGDPVWQRYLDGELTFTGYWAEYALANGYDDWRTLFRDLPFDEPMDDFVHPEAARLIGEAHDHGLRIGALTNDGVGINGMDFFRSIPTLARFDAFADAQEYGGKPAPGAYLNAAQQLGLDPTEIVFLDDTTYCVDGARAVGMHAVLVDPMDRRTGFDEARRIAGIGDVGRAQRLVERVEAAYADQDLDRIMSLFDPDITIHWNGRRVALGLDEARRFHVERLHIGDGSLRELRVRKRLRGAWYDTISVEYEATTVREDGTETRTAAGEFWTLRRDLVIEWHCYQHRLPDAIEY